VVLLLVGLVAGGFVWQRESGRRRERHLEATVAERTHKLDERVKELNCLYGISRLSAQPGISLEQILGGVVDLLPPAMQYPEIACTRIVLNGQEFEADDFRETPWGLSSAIAVRAEQAGHVELAYLEERPEADEGPFLEEERLLLNAVAERLGRIAERKQAEEALRKSEEAYRNLIENTSDVIYSVDAGGVVTYLNPAIESLLGLLPEQVVGRPFTQFILPEDLERAQDNIRKVMSGDSPGPAEYRVLTASNETRWIRVSSQPIVERGQVTGVQGVLTDITERKRVEGQLEEAATDAERQRLAAELHDSVTQGIYSAALIAETLPLIWEEDPEEGRRGLRQLERLTRGALAEMRTMLLELRPAALADQELPHLLRQLADGMMVRTQTVVTTTVVGDCSMPTEVKIALYRITQEALNNVVKHAKARQARVNLDADGEKITLRISDNGCGFYPEMLQSHGLGFGIMRDRARDIDAPLCINSQPNQGTEVLIVWEGSVVEKEP
jgi:PAS domain S-box-containing protein